jgi:hypothetical protein
MGLHIYQESGSNGPKQMVKQFVACRCFNEVQNTYVLRTIHNTWCGVLGPGLLTNTPEPEQYTAAT